MERLKKSLHWCHRMFWYTFAVLAILFAIAISLTRIFITDVKDYRQEVERFASSVLEQEVKIDSMEAQLSGFSPLIIFNGVEMLTDDGARELVRFDQARLTVDPLRSILNFRIIPKTLTVHGVVIGVTRKLDGTLSIQGLNLDELGGTFTSKGAETVTHTRELANWLFRRSELAIQNSTVVWLDEIQNNKVIQFQNVNFFLRNDEERHQLNGAVTLPQEYGKNLEIAFDFDGNLLDPDQWHGQFYAQGKALNLHSWGIKPAVVNAAFQSGLVDLKIWGESSAGQIRNLAADFSVHDFAAIVGEKRQPLDVKKLAGVFNWQSNKEGWLLQVENLAFEGNTGAWPETRLQIEYQVDENDLGRIDAYAGYLRLQDVGDFLTRSQLLPDDVSQTLAALQPQGQVIDLAVRTNLTTVKPQYRLSAKLDTVSIAPYRKFPGIKDFSGEVTANERQGQARILGKDSQIFLPTLFREPFDLANLQASVDWWHDNQQWYIQTRDVLLANADINGTLSALCILDDNMSAPYVDIQVDFQNGNALSVYKYLPVSIMDKELVAWLDHAFKQGKVTRGGFVLNGRLVDFPFRNFDGNMLADFYTEDVVIDYLPGWPTVLAKDGHLMITGLGIAGESRHGELYSSQLQQANFRIDDFQLPRLDVNGTFAGQTRDLIHYLVHSPIAKEAKEIYAQSKISGKVQGSLDLHAPLSKKAKAAFPLDYLVQTSIKDSRLDLWDNKLVVENISGDVSYRPKKLRSQNLQASLLKQDVALRLYSRAGEKSDEIQLTMKGKLDAQMLRDHIPVKLLENVAGVTDWDGVLSLGKWHADGRRTPGYFHFNSQLAGVTSSLPAPLTKAAEESKQLKVQLRLPENGVLPVYVRLGADLTAALALNLDENASAILKKGNVIFLDRTAQLPTKNELVINGWISQLPLTQWTRLFDKEGGTANKPVIDPAVPIRLDLDHVQVMTEESDSSGKTIDPRNIPLFNGEIRKLLYNDMNYGKINITTTRHAEGIVFENFTMAGPHLQVNGKGSWLLRDSGPLTNILVQANSTDLGALLGDLGFSAVIRNGQLQSVIQASWKDSPNKFDFAKLDASVGAVISDGIISEVKPGAGRLLGLLSLSELPRRLQLDFNEFRNGLAFSQVVGQLEISNGVSTVDTLRIISPVALMQIEGSTNLVDKTFDQSIRIVPNISGTAPIVSWLALGGQVGALVFLLDQLFGDTFDESVGTDYKVTGTWENPVIEKLTPELPPAGTSNFGE